MIGLLGQDLPVKLLGLAQPPGLVVLKCQIEGLLDRELGHAANGYYPMRISLSQQIAVARLESLCSMATSARALRDSDSPSGQ
jgi:hypothetical protein